MSTTLATIYQNLAKQVGFYFSGTASGTHSTTTLQDDSADGFDPYDTNIIVNKWLRITSAGSAAPEGESRRISSVTTSTVTVDTAFSDTPANDDEYEIVPYHPTLLIRAIQEAVRMSWPTLFQRLRNETLVVDSLLTNGDMETFTVANTPDNWTLANLSAGTTITKDTTRVFHGTSSIKCAPSGADGTASQNLFDSIEVHEMAGKTLHFHPRAWYDGSGTVKARVSFDNGSTFTDSADHSGSSEWQRLHINVTIPTTATTAIVYLFTEDGETAYWDFAPAWVGELTRYSLPSDFVTGPTAVSQQMFESQPNGLYLPVTRDNRAISGRILRLEGKGRLTVPSADSDTVEVDETQADFLVALAAEALFRNLKNSASGGERDTFEEERAYWAGQAQVRMAKPGVRMRMSGEPPRGGWALTENSESKTVELLR